MTTNFVQNAKPKTATSKSWVTWDFINLLKGPNKKNRHKRDRGDNQKTVKIIQGKKILVAKKVLLLRNTCLWIGPMKKKESIKQQVHVN